MEAIELGAGVSQPCYFHDGLISQMQSGAKRQGKEVEATGGDILANLAGRDIETSCTQLIMLLCMDEVNLAKVGLSRIGGDTGTMLHRLSTVSITFDPKTCQ